MILRCLLLATSLCQVCAAGAWAQYHPDHPRVKGMVDRGLEYLTSSDQQQFRGAGGYETGQQILVGYAVLKATGDIEHPRVREAVEASVRLANGLSSFRERGESKIVYETSMAAVLLASVDYGKYAPQLNSILSWFEQVQKPHGGFGYLERSTGDTSQVQYVILALWTMQQAGMDVPVGLVEDTLKYLKATLDPSGGWGYQGVLGNGRLVPQDGVTKSLATAGAGAVLIGGDILGFYGQRKRVNDTDEGIPDAFVRIDLREKLRAERRLVSMSRSDTEGVVNAARRYQNQTRFSGGFWYFYWRYSQERYESFVEIVENQQAKSPDWYNEGVEDLAARQADDGSFGAIGPRDHTGYQANTAFSILFLIRSTQKAIGKLDSGQVFGGYKLPDDVSTIKMVGDRIVSDEETSVENLLSMLEEDRAAGVEVGLLPKDLQLTRDPTQRKQQVARLARLLISEDPQARRIAAKLLGRSDDLNQVPELIFALSDPDPYVPSIAEEGLRLLSRKLTAGSLPVDPDSSQRQAAVEYWKKWYLGLRPDYIFIER